MTGARVVQKDENPQLGKGSVAGELLFLTLFCCLFSCCADFCKQRRSIALLPCGWLACSACCKASGLPAIHANHTQSHHVNDTALHCIASL